jgi:hypothetical protein
MSSIQISLSSPVVHPSSPVVYSSSQSETSNLKTVSPSSFIPTGQSQAYEGKAVNSESIAQVTTLDNFVPTGPSQAYSDQTGDNEPVVTAEDTIDNEVNLCRDRFYSVRAHYAEYLSASISLPVEANIVLQTMVINALSIIDKDEDIIVCKMNELGPLVSKLTDKENGRLFVVATSQGICSKSCKEIYSLDQVDELRKKVYKLIEDHTSSIRISSNGLRSYYHSYSDIVYSDDIGKEKQKVEEFIEKVQKQDKEDITFSLHYDITQDILSGTEFKADEIGHALGLDIRFKNNILTIISYNSSSGLSSYGFNYVDNISEIMHHIHDQIKDKNISSVLLRLPIGTEENGTDCTLHSFHFANTSKQLAEKMEELHEGLAAKDQNSIATFLKKEFPQEFFVITQKEKNFTDFRKEILHSENNELVLHTIQENTLDSFIFLFSINDRRTSIFFRELEYNTQGIMTEEKHQELTELNSLLSGKKPDEYDYTFLSLNVNITSNLQLMEMLNTMYYFMMSPHIVSLPHKDFSQLSSITQKMFDLVHKNCLARYSKILEQAKKFHMDSIVYRAEYAYKQATRVFLSEEFQQIKDMIPSKNSIKKEELDSSNPFCGLVKSLGGDKLSELPKKIDLLREKITSQEIQEDHNKIFDKSIVSLIDSIIDDLCYIPYSAECYIDLSQKKCKEQDLLGEDKTIVNIGDKFFCLEERLEATNKMRPVISKLHSFLSSTLMEIHSQREERNSEMLIKSWQQIIEYDTSKKLVD